MNSSGILIIGVGVFLLAMAYTGRLQAVWNALQGTGGTE